MRLKFGRPDINAYADRFDVPIAGPKELGVTFLGVATLLFDTEFSISDIEMIKGIEGMSYHDRLVVPIIENTARECDLAASLEAAIVAYPETRAVLVRRHGVYAWGKDWMQAKTQAECYDYLFRTAAEMRRLGIPTVTLKGVSDASLSSRPAEPFIRS